MFFSSEGAQGRQYKEAPMGKGGGVVHSTRLQEPRAGMVTQGQGQ